MRKVIRAFGACAALVGGMSLDNEGDAAYVAALLTLVGFSLLFATNREEKSEWTVPSRHNKARW